MIEPREIRIASLLIDIEASLRNYGFWDVESPPEHSLMSEQPFCIDTLEFYQWVQWVFMPKIRWMLEENMVLPNACGIAPMAEEWIKSQAVQADDLIRILDEIDQLITGSNSEPS